MIAPWCTPPAPTNDAASLDLRAPPPPPTRATLRTPCAPACGWLHAWRSRRSGRRTRRDSSGVSARRSSASAAEARASSDVRSTADGASSTTTRSDPVVAAVASPSSSTRVRPNALRVRPGHPRLPLRRLLLPPRRRVRETRRRRRGAFRRPRAPTPGFANAAAPRASSSVSASSSSPLKIAAGALFFAPALASRTRRSASLAAPAHTLLCLAYQCASIPDALSRVTICDCGGRPSSSSTSRLAWRHIILLATACIAARASSTPRRTAPWRRAGTSRRPSAATARRGTRTGPGGPRARARRACP